MLAHISFENDRERSLILNSVFHRGVQYLKTIEDSIKEFASNTGEGLKRLAAIIRFKLCECPRTAAEMITLNKFELEHCPSHLYCEAQVTVYFFFCA